MPLALVVGSALLHCGAVPPGRWEPVPDFSDEFDDAALNATRWDTSPPSWGAWDWNASQVAQGDGALSITMSYDPHPATRWNGTIYYYSGIAKSRLAAGTGFGYYEARIKGADRWPGVCPAFWAWRHAADYWTELDFVEMQENDLSPRDIDFTWHLFPPTVPKHVMNSTHTVFPFDPRDEYHVYGMEWNETTLTWWVDGTVVKQGPAGPQFALGRPMDVALSFGVRPPLAVHGVVNATTANASGFPTSFSVDYVRAYRRVG